MSMELDKRPEMRPSESVKKDEVLERALKLIEHHEKHNIDVRDSIKGLRGTVAKLTTDNERLGKRIIRLQQRVSKLEAKKGEENAELREFVEKCSEVGRHFDPEARELKKKYKK